MNSRRQNKLPERFSLIQNDCQLIHNLKIAYQVIFIYCKRNLYRWVHQPLKIKTNYVEIYEYHDSSRQLDYIIFFNLICTWNGLWKSTKLYGELQTHKTMTNGILLQQYRP